MKVKVEESSCSGNEVNEKGEARNLLHLMPPRAKLN
jgi:hypothetical protein